MEKALPEKGELMVSYLWPMCSLLQAHNDMEKLFPNRVLSENTLQVIKKYTTSCRLHRGMHLTVWSLAAATVFTTTTNGSALLPWMNLPVLKNRCG